MSALLEIRGLEVVFDGFRAALRYEGTDTSMLVALAALPGWLASAVSVLSLIDYAISFARLHLQADRVWAQAAWFDQAVFWPMVAIRYAALCACAVWAFAHSVRKREVPTA